MKLLKRYIDKESNGQMVILPDESEDMWHIYNIIDKGDHIKASTYRKVQVESATGSSSSSRVRTNVTLAVESTDFDIGASLLRVKGRNVVENKFIKMGGYHTIDLEPNRKFTLIKEFWNSVTLERVENCCEPAKNADLAAIVMQEGLSYVVLITKSMTIEKAKIDVNIPKKGRRDDVQRKKAWGKFFDLIMTAVNRHINFDIVKAVIIASPGFVKDEFFAHMLKEAVRLDNRIIIENKSKFILAHSTSGFKGAIKDVLENPSIAAKLSDTKALGESKALQNFMNMLATDESRAYYGYNHVKLANESQAIETLLISDSLFRSNDLAERKKFVGLVDSVRDNGGEVKIFSSLHLTGEQLDDMTGLAAILRFPMPEIDEEEGGLD